jgi:hypothetical protein
MYLLSLHHIFNISMAAVLFLYLNAWTLTPVKKEKPDAACWISEIKSSLKNGDLVLRLNNDPSSQLIKLFNRRDKSFSPAGILIMENNEPYVYHMISGVENPGDKLKKEKLEDFTNRKNNSSLGIYRYKMTKEEINKVVKMISGLYKSEITFDSELDLTSEDKLYCAEMVKKLIEGATGKKISIGTTVPGFFEARVIANHIKVPFSIIKKREIVAIDNLYTVPGCTLVKKINWN